jgi:undecaprenyl-diphosphatase
VVGIAQLIAVVVLGIAHIAPLGGAAHQTLIETFASWPPLSGIVYLALSVGLLLSIMTYFWSDLWDMGVGLVRAAKGKRDPGARLAMQLFIASIPVAAIVFALPFTTFSFPAYTPTVVGWSAVIGGAFLFILDRMSMTIKRLEHASYIDMTVVALAQVVAYLVPGVSRSGITMTFARALGYERVDAARFSMLLGMPALAGSCLLQVLALVKSGGLMWQPWLLGIGGAAFFAGLITLAVMMAWLRRHSFAPFAIYRLLIGAVILVIAWQTPT